MRRPFVPARHQVISLPEGRRVLAVSDIHGRLSYLKGVLAAARFSPDDILILLGDLVEKGPDSLGTLRYVLELQKTHTVYAVSGNCDGMLWEEFPDELVFADMQEAGDSMALNQLARVLDFPVRGPDDLPRLRARAQEAFGPELDYLDALPTILESEDYLFVHGGLPQEDSLHQLDRWSCMKNDNFVSQGKTFSKWCVVGHWPATLYRPDLLCCDPYTAPAQHILSIDGGCVINADGQLNAVVLPAHPDGQFTWFRYDSLPRCRAMDEQAPSSTPFSLKWGNNRVEVLRREGDCAWCRHLPSGRALWVPEDRLWEGTDGTHAIDGTDYALPVRAGETVSLVKKTSRGTLIKKDGTTGWYFGRLVPEENTDQRDKECVL